ncbi:MAG: RsfS/YbeB/iojap family protein, partial [Paraclostridium sp.]
MTVEQMVKVIYDAIDDKLGKDISIINIGAVSSLCDYFIIATAGSTRQVKAVADNIEDELTKLGIES